jgi:hypothetical protein
VSHYREDRNRILDQQPAILDMPEQKAHPLARNPNRIAEGAASGSPDVVNRMCLERDGVSIVREVPSSFTSVMYV